MSFEIEKKYIVGNFDNTLNNLEKDFGKYAYHIKRNFWWSNNYLGIENILELGFPKLLKKEVGGIKDIGEFILPLQDYQFVRLRIFDEKIYLVTFKNKQLQNKIEQNTEYEFDVDKETFKRIVLYLKETSLIFYWNIKESWEFCIDDIKIDLSKFNDLKDAYLEIEVLGNIMPELNTKLDKFLVNLANYKLKDESRNYSEISYFENQNQLKRKKILDYSRESFKILQKYI